MITRITILLFFLLAKTYAVGQRVLPGSVFYEYTQLCHLIGTTEKDFVMEILNDSTVKISEYTSNYRDQYSSLLRFTYFGRYTMVDDTLKITYLTHKCELRHKLPPKYNVQWVSPSDSFFLYPPHVYLFRDGLLTSVNENSLALTKSNPVKATELEAKFINWDKSNIVKYKAPDRIKY